MYFRTRHPRLTTLASPSKSRLYVEIALAISPLMKFTHSIPSIGILLPNPLPKLASKLLWSTLSKRQIMFQPCGFSPLRWFTLRLKLRVYCAPQPILGFVPFSWFCLLTTRRGNRQYKSSTRWVRTLLRIPLISSILRLRKLYLLTIHTCVYVCLFLVYGFPHPIISSHRAFQLSLSRCFDSLHFRKNEVSRRKLLNSHPKNQIP